ncbi:MAG: hypothetical protein V1754_15785 [Pseudomonadota bacterium]
MTKKSPAATSSQTTTTAPKTPNWASESDQVSSEALQRGARVEFDARLVRGQSAQAGAIYLFARPRSELKSMVKERASYRKEILRIVFPKHK